MKPESVALLLASYKFRFADEIELHEAIAAALDEQMIKYSREFRLTPHERLDFFVSDDNIAIEVKIKGRSAEVLRQLTRYSEHSMIHGLVLVTTRRLQACQMPMELNGKPLAVASIGGL
jgi:hypothetical protein